MTADAQRVLAELVQAEHVLRSMGYPLTADACRDARQLLTDRPHEPQTT